MQPTLALALLIASASGAALPNDWYNNNNQCPSWNPNCNCPQWNPNCNTGQNNFPQFFDPNNGGQPPYPGWPGRRSRVKRDADADAPAQPDASFGRPGGFPANWRNSDPRFSQLWNRPGGGGGGRFGNRFGNRFGDRFDDDRFDDFDFDDKRKMAKRAAEAGPDAAADADAEANAPAQPDGGFPGGLPPNWQSDPRFAQFWNRPGRFDDDDHWDDEREDWFDNDDKKVKE